MQGKQDSAFCFKNFLIPRNNHWLKRTALLFAFIIFDYLVTLALCYTPYEEANLYARVFMENFGIPLGLTLFVLMANLPIYMVLSLDSHIVKFPFRMAAAIETLVDFVFAWFVAGLHFSGGSSWVWFAPDWTRQTFGALLYLFLAFLIVRPHKPSYVV
ncbi:MAG: hypothetical protein QHH17_00700 [Candidatus Bathyarchaeota archaeon]|jgi:hypothetical protein|nr:hypothetical protein [Candidatus Bathyarchaeota archaeon]